MDFAFPVHSVQSSRHIRRLHWYVSCRLVIEGGFDPRNILPRPPILVQRQGNRRILHHAPEAAKQRDRYRHDPAAPTHGIARGPSNRFSASQAASLRGVAYPRYGISGSRICEAFPASWWTVLFATRHLRSRGFPVFRLMSKLGKLLL